MAIMKIKNDKINIKWTEILLKLIIIYINLNIYIYRERFIFIYVTRDETRMCDDNGDAGDTIGFESMDFA